MLKSFYQKLAGIIAGLALIALVLAGCSNPADDDDENDGGGGTPQSAIYTSTDADGNFYTLTVTEDADRSARYTTQAGDRFELKIELFNDGNYSLALNYSGLIGTVNTGGSGVSLGITVNNVALNITISGTTMTVISGAAPIPLDNGQNLPPPESVTPVMPVAPDPGPAPGVETELTGNITTDTTLGRAGERTAYVWNGNTMNVQNNATLKILPGTTITFTNAGGGIRVDNGATLIMSGAPVLLDAQNNPITSGGLSVDGRIYLRGGAAKGSWKGIEIHSITENVLNYVNILNSGSGTADYSSALYLYDGSASVTNCVIDGSASNGITTYDTNGYFTAFAGNTVSNCGKAPVYTESALWSLRNISGSNTFTGNVNSYIHVASAGSMSASMTIKRMSVPYHVYGNLAVNGEAVLTVEPGTEIRFGNAGSGIRIDSNAGIVMEGTEQARITLRGVNTNKGAWEDIEIHSTRDENKLNYVDILNGGSGTAGYSSALYLYNGSASVTNCVIDGSASNGITTYDNNGYFTAFAGNTVSNCEKAPVYTESAIWSLRNISGNNAFTGNANNYIHVGTNASPSGNMTVKKLTVPWYLENGLNINHASNPALTIEPGTQIWVNGDKEISVGNNANLVARGTAAERIVFRGSTDQKGYWRGIRVDTDLEGTEFAYCDISGGGRTDDWGGNRCLYIYNATVELFNVTISKSLRYGVGLEGDNKIWSSGVTFSNIDLGNVWYYSSGQTADALPTNNFTPETLLQ
jgi:plastocyanin